jgi:predicted Zn finger-like uncharacterized protein
MQIVCPSCASRYELDAAKLGPAGRRVRCASCQTLWHVDPGEAFPEAPSAEDTQALLNEELQRASEIEEQISAVAAEHEVEPARTDDATVSPPRKRGSRAKTRKGAFKPGKTLNGLSAPVALTLAGLAVIGGLVWQRNLAVRVAPQLAGVFETLGLSVNVRGLSLTAVESGLVQDGQGRFLVVEGDVTNITRGVAAVPPIEVAVKDAAGQTLYTWTTDPPRSSLEPAELMRFRARLAAPPDTGKSVRVRFGEAKAPTMAKAN